MYIHIHMKMGKKRKFMNYGWVKWYNQTIKHITNIYSRKIKIKHIQINIIKNLINRKLVNILFKEKVNKECTDMNMY